MSILRLASIETDLSVCLNLGFDTDMLIHVVPSIEVDGDPEPSLLEPISLEDLVEEIMIDLIDTGNYTNMYCLAHEFSRVSNQLYAKALQMENSDSQIAMKFDLDPMTLIGGNF